MQLCWTCPCFLLCQVLNQIVCELPSEHPLSETRPLRELLGHTPTQVCSNALFILLQFGRLKVMAYINNKKVMTYWHGGYVDANRTSSWLSPCHQTPFYLAPHAYQISHHAASSALLSACGFPSWTTILYAAKLFGAKLLPGCCWRVARVYDSNRRANVHCSGKCCMILCWRCRRTASICRDLRRS